MKLLFATLLCHRDIEFFLLNWFTMRVHLDHGFDIPHLILNDGTLTDEDFSKLNRLPNLLIEKEKVHLYDYVPKPIYLAKLEGFNIGFNKYDAERVVVMDCDIFYFKNWESDLRKICQSPSIALRDWGSSLGPNVDQYRNLFGVHEDAITPNCNSGISSMTKDQYPKLKAALEKHLSDPFLIMEDQGVLFAAFYGQLEYVNGIKCAVMGGENIPEIKNWWFSQNAVHLMGMRERQEALKECIELSIQNIPKSLPLKQFTPEGKQISWGLLEHDTYSFNSVLQYYPSSYQYRYITDATYFHGGSHLVYKFPPHANRFTAKFICMDTGIADNVLPLSINGQEFQLEADIDVKLDGTLSIISQNGNGAHLALLSPRVHLNCTF